MRARGNIQCAFGLLAGGAIALYFVPVNDRSPHRLVFAESGLLVLPREAPSYEGLESIAANLEQGTISSQAILAATLRLAEVVQHYLSSSEGASADLVWNDNSFGKVVIHPQSPEGARTWDFEIVIAPPARYEGMADETTISITYVGNSGTITKVIAMAGTHVHRHKNVVDIVRSNPYVVGGSLIATTRSSTWQQETLTFDDSSGKDIWISALSDPRTVPGRIELLEENSMQVAAFLFSL